MDFVSENIKMSMGGWMGGAMSVGGRVIKIKACLANSVVYQMSMRLLHKTNIEKMEKSIRSFLWAGNSGHTTRENLICGAPIIVFCGAWVVHHRIFITKISILWRTSTCATEIMNSVAHHSICATEIRHSVAH
jgi:hypothetical protein